MMLTQGRASNDKDSRHGCMRLDEARPGDTCSERSIQSIRIHLEFSEAWSSPQCRSERSGLLLRVLGQYTEAGMHFPQAP